MTTNTHISPDTRVRIIGRPRVTGMFIGYYAPLPSGSRNVEVVWDDASLVLTLNESQSKPTDAPPNKRSHHVRTHPAHLQGRR